MYDVLIIGGGVTGSAIARELSRYDLKTALFEKGEDVCSGTSKANSGIAHAGFDAAPGSWKAKMNIRGSRMLEELSRKLDFPYKRNGSLVLCFDEKDRPHLEKLLEQGKKNGVEGLEILEKKELLALEPASFGGCGLRPSCADRRHRLPLQTEHRSGGECGCERGGVPSEGRSADSRKGRLSGTCGRLSCGDGERKL